MPATANEARALAVPHAFGIGDSRPVPLCKATQDLATQDQSLCAPLNMVTMLMAVTAPFHQLFLFDMQVQPFGSAGALSFAQGPWYRFYMLYNQLLPLFAFGLMLAGS